MTCVATASTAPCPTAQPPKAREDTPVAVACIAFVISFWIRISFVRKTDPSWSIPSLQSLDNRHDPFLDGNILGNSMHPSHPGSHRWCSGLPNFRNCIRRRCEPAYAGSRTSYRCNTNRRLLIIEWIKRWVSRSSMYLDELPPSL